MRRKHKYNNKIVKINGQSFDSEGEYTRYKELEILERVGLIKDLKRQVRIKIINKPDVYYVADFVYKEDGKLIVEDFKGYVTEVFKLKSKIIRSKLNSGEFNFIFRITKRKGGRTIIFRQYD